MTQELKDLIQAIKNDIQKDIESDVEVCYTPESVLEIVKLLEKMIENETV